MSEYQYFEFAALDRPLTQSEMAELRRYSSRARITPTSFVNVYHWGDFKGDRRLWMEKYFDAFLYVANWGTRRVEFRIPKRLLDPDTVSPYCTKESFACRVKDASVILSFSSENEGGEWTEGEGWLASLTGLRTGLMNGDHRCLYLGWLVAAQAGLLEDHAIEPPVPPGLAALGEPLQTLADFLRIDMDIIRAAAEESAPEQDLGLTQEEIGAWVASLALSEKDSAIATLIEGRDSYFVADFRQRAVCEILHARRSSGGPHIQARRSVGQILARAESIREERRVRAAKIQARERAKREREQTEQRMKYLGSIAGKAEGFWPTVDQLIATKNPRCYDQAVSLLQDLRDLAVMTNQTPAFSSRMEALVRAQSRKPTLMDRFRKANLSS